MTTDNLKVELLERILRMEAEDAVLNCFHRFLQYLSIQHKPGVLSCFALQHDDVSFESGKSGVYVGAAALTEYFEHLHEMARLRGLLYEEFSLNHVVEVAKDCRTAKLTSISPGISLNAPARVQAWNNGKFYVDFIYDEEFGWKIWHLHRFLTFKSEMERGPIHSQYTEKIERSAKVYADCFKAKPTKPTTYFSLFNPKARNYLLPEPPSAYESWDGMTDLERTRPYHNPDRPETMEGEVQTIVRLGRSEEGIGKAW